MVFTAQTKLAGKDDCTQLGGGGGCGPPSLKKLRQKLRKIAVKIAVQWSARFFTKRFFDQLRTQLAISAHVDVTVHKALRLM